MKDFFNPKMFGDYFMSNITIQDAVNVANRELQMLIESWPVVTGYKDSDGYFTYSTYESDTHTARLAFIEEIKKDCKHEPIRFQDDEGNLAMNPICQHCGVELVAEWREVK